jgi:hypothetical protein
VAREALALWQREFDGMLDRLQGQQPSVVVAREVTSTHCKRPKEDTCVRRKSKAVVGKDMT